MGDVADPLDAQAIARAAAIDDALAGLASEALPLVSPAYSAKGGASAKQILTLTRTITLVGLAGLFMPAVLFMDLSALALLVFGALILWRASLTLLGAVRRLWPGRKFVRVNDETLPIYTLLVPLYREAETVPGLARAISELDYPPDKLDLKLLIEAGDEATAEALLVERWPHATEILTLPPGIPQTKPRALNFGLQRARGEVTAIYDAEDRPHPSQLRAALQALARGGDRMAGVQAPLKAHNSRETWVAGQWALEYAIHFGLIIPAMTLLRVPIPLGGTSNHFRTDVLRESGGWDAWNVTEDADLGLRLARMGWRFGFISPPTLEEAPESIRVWTAQRSRWLKGFMVTWLVIMREPKRAIRELGLLGFLAAQLSIAGPVLAAIAHGPLAFWCLACLVSGEITLGALGVGLLTAGYAVNAASAILSPGRFRLRRLWLILTLPFYWPLQSIAAVRAVYGLLNAPHFWAKTPHGLTARAPLSLAAAFAE